MINDNTPITDEILIRNGWKLAYNEYEFGKIAIEANEGFACWLRYDGWNIGEPFFTIGELKSIAKALYKVELKFE